MKRVVMFKRVNFYFLENRVIENNLFFNDIKFISIIFFCVYN